MKTWQMILLIVVGALLAGVIFLLNVMAALSGPNGISVFELLQGFFV